MRKGSDKVMKSESLVIGNQRSYLRAKVSILSEVCPSEQGKPSCPLHPLKKSIPEERIASFDKLSEEAISNIYTYCRLCLEVKEKLG